MSKPARSAFADARPRDAEGLGMSPSDVARILGVTRQRVYQLEMRALRKLRAAMESEGLTFESIVPETKGGGG